MKFRFFFNTFLWNSENTIYRNSRIIALRLIFDIYKLTNQDSGWNPITFQQVVFQKSVKV